MRILLIGEYSRLHNSLKEGLLKLGCEVVLTSSGDSFKKFPSDFLYTPHICNLWFFAKIRNLTLKLINFDIEELERGTRFYFLLRHFKNFDVVQLINEKPIQTLSFLEYFLLKKIFKNNNKVFLLSAGVDKINVEYILKNKQFKSLLLPLFEDETLKKHYDYVFTYLKRKHQKTHQLVYNNCRGIIASDMDYLLPLRNDRKYCGMIPNPINVEKFIASDLEIGDKTIVFLGINRGNYHQKGIRYFEQALATVKEKYPTQIEIIIAENLAYEQYILHYNRCHILLDQVFAFDQGYNALEAMAIGKVVFTGAETEFENYYNLTEKVAINAKPDIQYLVNNLSFLIENPFEIMKISARAKAFIQKEHHFINVSKQYIALWEKL